MSSDVLGREWARVLMGKQCASADVRLKPDATYSLLRPAEAGRYVPISETGSRPWAGR